MCHKKIMEYFSFEEASIALNSVSLFGPYHLKGLSRVLQFWAVDKAGKNLIAGGPAFLQSEVL